MSVEKKEVENSYYSKQLQRCYYQPPLKILHRRITKNLMTGKRETLSALVAETKDLQKKKKISLFVCYYYLNAIFESFLQS